MHENFYQLVIRVGKRKMFWPIKSNDFEIVFYFKKFVVEIN